MGRDFDAKISKLSGEEEGFALSPEEKLLERLYEKQELANFFNKNTYRGLARFSKAIESTLGKLPYISLGARYFNKHSKTEFSMQALNKDSDFEKTLAATAIYLLNNFGRAIEEMDDVEEFRELRQVVPWDQIERGCFKACKTIKNEELRASLKEALINKFTELVREM